MKVWLRHTLLLTAAAAFGTGMLVIRGACNRADAPKTCRGIEITVEGTHKFVTEEDVSRYMSKHFGKLKGCRLDSLPLSRIEKVLDEKSAILKSQAWYTSDSLLHVSVTQRRPVARFMKEGTGFYVDDRGFIFPLHPGYTAPVPVISGNIPVYAGGSYRGPAASAAEREWLESMLKTLSEMGGSGIWEGSFPSISVNAQSDLVLEQEGGAEKIIYGRPDHDKEKLSGIRTYYSKIKPNKPEGFYKSINVKYNGQIVCRQ